MEPDTPLDYALLLLSPCRSRCELVVSGRSRTEAIASGLVKPFLVHLGIEDGKAAQSIRLDGVSAPWFNKGTLERFVRFVSTPEVLELAATLDAEMSQLEGARKIYFQGTGEPTFGSDELIRNGSAAADMTKRELLQAIDVRLAALRQDLITACSRASSAGFTRDSIAELLLFADQFGARRLSESCKTFTSVCQRRPDLVAHLSPLSRWKGFDGGNASGSSGSDMSVDEAEIEDAGKIREQYRSSGCEVQPTRLSNSQHLTEGTVMPRTDQQLMSASVGLADNTGGDRSSASAETVSVSSSDQLAAVGGSGRMSVQDRINLFENKKKDQAPNSTGTTSYAVTQTTTMKSGLRRVPSMEKSVLHRWPGASDTSIDPSNTENRNISDKKDNNIVGTQRPVNFEGKSLSRTCSDTGVLADTAASDVLAYDGSETACLTPTVDDTGSLMFNSMSSSAQTVLSQVKDCIKDKSTTAARELDVHKDGRNAYKPQFENSKAPGKMEPSLPGKKIAVVDPQCKAQSDSRIQMNSPHFEEADYAGNKIPDIWYKSKDVPRKAEKFGGKKLPDSNVSSLASSTMKGDSAHKGEISDNQSSYLGKEHNTQDGRYGSVDKRNSASSFSGNRATEFPAALSPIDPSLEHANKAKSMRGDMGLNDDLQIKAEETQMTHSPILGEESRGKSYEKYMSRRETKLREEWNLMREQKEATMKALQDMLKLSEAEMRRRIAQSSEAQRSAHGGRCMKMSSILSSIRNTDQGAGSLLEEQFEQVQYDQDIYNSDNLSGDNSSRSTESRKQRSRENTSISARKTSVSPIPKPSGRSSNAKSANRRITENIVARPVPSISDLKKENTKPPTGIRRNSARVQAKNFLRTKSVIEESNSILKEDHSRRSQSMRRITGQNELDDILAINEDIYDFLDSNRVKGQRERSFAHRAEKSSGTKSSIRTYNGTSPVVGVARIEGMFVSNTCQNGDRSKGFLEYEDSADDVKDEGDYEKTSIEENLRESDFPAESESETPGLVQEFNSDDGGSDSGDILHAINFNNFSGSTRVSGESPFSWNSHLPHILSYSHDTVDVDDFVESLGRSPAPWDSLESHVTRMRKKWGDAQESAITATPSAQSHKDLTRGFKKLLKYGRKSRVVDTLLNDSVSASTNSEGDDDLEDGHDLIVGSSDDTRKSRVGYLPSHDGFIENEIFNEQAQSLRSLIPNPPPSYRPREDRLTGSSLKAPRSSLFSLPAVRAKGGDAKPR